MSEASLETFNYRPVKPIKPADAAYVAAEVRRRAKDDEDRDTLLQMLGLR